MGTVPIHLDVLAADYCNVQGAWSGEPTDDVTGGMGTPPTTNKQLQNILEEQPELVTWSSPPVQVTLLRGPARKLGIKLHTFQGKHETYTVVTKVKDDCRIIDGKLRVFDRIVCINNYETIHDRESHVLNLLSTAAGHSITLTASRPQSIHTSPNPGSTITESTRIKSHSSFGSLNVPVCRTETNTSHGTGNSFFVEEVTLRPTHCQHTDNVHINSNLSPEAPDNSSSHCLQEGDHCKTSRNAQSDSAAEGCSASSLGNCSCTGGNCPVIKRGISQVSGSSNNPSTCSTPSSSHKAAIMGKSKGDKLVKRFYKSSSQDNNDNCEELEPLKSSEAVGAAHGGRLDSKYNHFQVECERAMSVPIQKDIAVSMQDIVFFEDQAQSLPVVQPISNPGVGPSPSCPCATCVVTAELCGNCGNKPSSSPRKPRSPGIPLIPETTEGLIAEDYGSFLLKNPHLALWDGANTHVVEIDKGSAAEFGFTYKVKIGKNQDASVEIYTLVESLAKGGPAFGKLKIGDWIRSVNGTPIQIPMDAFSLLSSSRKEKSKRLVIQRPVGFSQQLGSSSSPPLPTTDKGDKPPTQEFPLPPAVVSPPYTLGPRELQDPLLPDSPLPGGVQPKNVATKCEKKAPRKIYIPSAKESSSNSDTEPGVPSFPKVVKLPKVKIFICGGEAMKCVSLIFKDSKIDLDFRRSSYSFVDCSMATNSFGSIVISPSCSNLFSASVSQSNVSISSMEQSDTRSSESKCKHCGNEFHSTSSHSLVGTVANAEIYIVPDDKLFHHCCTYLLTKSSIFILTFDGAKLLRSLEGEIRRLQNLSHTIRSLAGYDCHIMSCGLLEKSSDPRSTADEVKTLFYTSVVNQLQNYNVTGPQLITYNDNIDTDADDHTWDGLQQIQAAIWKAVTETIQRQHVLQPSLVVMECLAGMRERESVLTEAQLMDMVRHKLPAYQQDIHQMVLTDLITSAEIISEKAAPISVPSQSKTESLVVVNPRMLLDMFHNVITAITDDKPRWTRVHSTGCVRMEDFLELCADSDNLRRTATQFLECYGLIFRRYSAQLQQREYYLPYFALDPSSAACPAPDRKEHVLCLQFKEHESIQVFFQLMFGIAGHSDAPDSIAVQAVNCCSFCHAGFVIRAYHQKLEDRVKLYCRSSTTSSREDKPASTRLPELFRWLYWGCRQTLPQEVHFQLAAPCPRGDSCHTSTAPSIHLIDLKDSAPQYCGSDRVDTHKSVRVWKPHDAYMSARPTNASGTPDLPPKVLELPYSVFSRVCLKLKVPSPLDRDWKGLAGLMGCSVEDVQLYETVDNPPRELLRDWSHSHNASVHDLIRLLSQLDREDIVADIQNALAATEENATSSGGQEHSGDHTGDQIKILHSNVL